MGKKIMGVVDENVKITLFVETFQQSCKLIQQKTFITFIIRQCFSAETKFDPEQTPFRLFTTKIGSKLKSLVNRKLTNKIFSIRHNNIKTQRRI